MPWFFRCARGIASDTRESGWSPLTQSCDRLVQISRVEKGRVPECDMVERLFDRHLGSRPKYGFGTLHCQRGVGGDLGGELPGGVEEAGLVLIDVVDQADLLCPDCIYVFAGVDELGDVAGREDRREPL